MLHDRFTRQIGVLFQHAGKWASNCKLQQAHAPCHQTATNVGFIAYNVSVGHFLEWPATSPDLSPIPRWTDSRLRRLQICKKAEELKQKLKEIRQSVPSSDLHSLFDGINNRMKRDTDHIGK